MVCFQRNNSIIWDTSKIETVQSHKVEEKKKFNSSVDLFYIKNIKIYRKVSTVIREKREEGKRVYIESNSSNLRKESGENKI